MRRLLTWLVVSLGIAALIRRLRKRRSAEAAVAEEQAPAPAAAPAETDAEDDPAGELKRKLAESRADEEEEVPPVSTVEERRADVHGQGRAALDEMNEPGES